MSIYKYSDDEIVVEAVDEEETREAVAIALDEHLPAALRPGNRRSTEAGGFACNRQLPAGQPVQERLSPQVPPRLGKPRVAACALGSSAHSATTGQGVSVA